MRVHLFHIKYMLFLWIAVLIAVSVSAEARLDLFVLRPAEEFVTNNKELVVEGIVRYPEVNRVAVSINTPAGVSDPGALEESLQGLIVDIGSANSLTAMVLSPVFEDGLSLGPRVVNLSFSENGQNYSDRGIFNCSSGTEQDYGEARVEFGAPIVARYVRIDMLDGWQTSRIGVQEVKFLNTAGEMLSARIRGISIALDLDENGEAYFRTTVLLRAGENQISIAATSPDLIEDVDERFELVTVTYMPEVVIEEEPLALSDGYRAELLILPSALRNTIKKIGINPVDVKDIEWTSYSDNTRIKRDTFPVMAYEFTASIVAPFPATAKDSLERQPPGLAVDGNPDYPSTWMTTTSALPVWLNVDLRRPRSIGKVIVTAMVDDGISYGPERMVILTSDDNLNYDEAAVVDECDDRRTEVELPKPPEARYVQILIEEGKQGNNIQINEVEFYSNDNEQILSYVQLEYSILARPAELTLLYDDLDLSSAGVQQEEDLAIFSWNAGMQEWTMIGGEVDPVNNWITVNLNHLNTFAVFEAASPVEEVHWSYNPFSPNGDGIADTTTISININEEAARQVRVEIFDHTGRLIRSLIHESLGTGHISIVWDGTDENGEMVSIGPYIYQVHVGGEVRNGLLVVAR